MNDGVPIDRPAASGPAGPDQPTGEAAEVLRAELVGMLADARAMAHAGVPPAEPRRRRGGAWLRLGVMALAVLLLAGAAAAGGYALLSRDDGSTAGGCPDSVTVRVAVSAEYADAIVAAAARFRQMNERLGDACINVSPIAVPDAELATALTRTGDIAALVAEPGEVANLSRAIEDNEIGLGEPVVVAHTLPAIAVPRPMAQALGWPDKPPTWSQLAQTLVDPSAWRALGHPEYGTFTLSLADPAASTASLATIAELAATAAGKPLAEVTPEDLGSQRVQGSLLALTRQVTRNASLEGDLVEDLRSADAAGDLTGTTSAVLLGEQAVWRYNQSGPRVPLVALYPDGGALGIDVAVTSVTGADADSAERAGAEAFATFLAGDTGQQALGEAGLRGARSGTSPVLTADAGFTPDPPLLDGAEVSPDVLGGIAAGWSRLQNPGRFLVLMDISGSMQDGVAGTGRTKLQFAQDAAIQGMRLVPVAAEIGLWQFSTRLDGSRDYRELVPLGAVGEQVAGQTRLDGLVGAVEGLTPRGDTGLYDSALAAFRSVQETYSPGEPNVVVLLTDGRNDDPGSVSLRSLVSTLKAEQDAERPVRFLTIAYGADADTAALARIASATGGSAYASPNPADIGSVFFRALTSA